MFINENRLKKLRIDVVEKAFYIYPNFLLVVKQDYVNCNSKCFLSTFIQGEGVAYRGRVLVELDTKLNASCTAEKDAISQTDAVKVQVSDNQEIRLSVLKTTLTSLRLH